ncbi:hypothetical protein [Polyangium mundeleinium]|uniref:DUF4351 domain-containing protein n=1 Tax=Polyangium mundeleinium TaxID=2995306 RepID=A0ABT5EPY9_9BACT|nr:hypothetical protein [Polyangium mundeleinium]MDC0743899.1 hypothetical protein [Polyangium mundeleinium]
MFVLDPADEPTYRALVPSLLHEALVELFRNRPVLAAELLAEALSVPLPRFTEARIEAADLTDIVPRERRADLLVLLLEERPVLVILVEVQLQWDPDKPFVWPAYVAGARARYRCPACLLVVTPDATLASRLAKPIELGPGRGSVVPLVLGPQGVPVVTDLAEAARRPELAVLSALAHGQTEVALDVAVAALAATTGVEDNERKALYADLVLFSVGEAARKALERLVAMRNYEYQSEFGREMVAKGREEGREEGREQGREQGRAEGLRPLVHMVERRLGRAMTSAERSSLVELLRKQGPDRVGDAVLDLSPAELATWIGAASEH